MRLREPEAIASRTARPGASETAVSNRPLRAGSLPTAISVPIGADSDSRTGVLGSQRTT